MHILVTGAGGMLGKAVKKVFSDHNLILTDRKKLDITDIKKVMSYSKKKIDLILHLAAETDLTRAEMNITDTYMINTIGTGNMVALAQKLNIPIVYVSTAMIFDGLKKKYNENDIANPTNHYGRSKYYGELIVAGYKKHYIVRNGWAFGGGPLIDKKFIIKVFKQIEKGAKKLYGIKDIYGSPTFTVDFAETLKMLVEKKAPFGIYNAPGKGPASRFDVLKAFVEDLGLSEKIEIVPVTVKEYLKLFPSNFPYIKNEVITLGKIEKMGLSKMRDWKVALSEYSKEFKLE